MSRLTIYFTLHRFRSELRNEDFLRAFQDCDSFLVEAADQWPSDDWQDQYNELSQGRRDTLGGVIENLLPPLPFQRELECRIYCSGKKIVLEHSRFSSNATPRDYIDPFSGFQKDFDEALTQYKVRCQETATRMVQQDRDLLGLIENQLKGEVRLLTFRGAAHQNWICELLESRNIKPKVIRFLPRKTSDERVLEPLTLGEKVSDVEYLKRIYVQWNAKEELEKHLEVEAQAEAVTDTSLRAWIVSYVACIHSLQPTRRTDLSLRDTSRSLKNSPR